MAKLEIQIQTRKMLKPSIPTPNHLRNLKLSLFDQLSPRMYLPILFHYLPIEGITTKSLCDKLQNSLAETLTKFYPLAGRCIEDELSIHCNDEGIVYVETKVVNVDLVEFLHKGRKNIELLNDLLPEIDDQALLGVQVNVFNCGGLVIGIQMSHIIADAFTLATFVNEWAHVCQTGTLKAGCLLSFGRLHSLFPPIGSITQFLVSPNDIISSGPSKIVTKRFVFDALAIANLKNTIKDSVMPTRVVVVMSLIWKVLINISNEHSREVPSISFAINLRGKTKIPSLDHDLGNCTIIEIINAEARKEELNELVGNKIRDTCLLISKATNVDDISSLIVSNLTKLVGKFLQGDKINDVYPSTSWCRFPWYEADFGWGKPFWVSSVSYNDGELTILMDTKNGGGIEAWVTLNENVMAEFERDPHILSYTSNHPFLDLDKTKLY